MTNARKKLLVFAAAFTVFACADAWVFLTIRKAFIGIVDGMQAKQVDLFVGTAPLDPADISDGLNPQRKPLRANR